MRRLFSLLVGFLLVVGCGYQEGEMTLASRPAHLENTLEESLQSDTDVQMVSMQAWIDMMPSIGLGTGPTTRLQIRFLVPSFGCTSGHNFRTRLVQNHGKQILVIKRTQLDTCHESMFRTEINHAVEGLYIPGKPVIMNGEEIPVFESIIN